MILLTVGTQFPFDRMVKVVDDWAVEADRSDVKAQIGPSHFVPRKLDYFDFSSPSDLRQMQEECDLMVAHAGMGSILTALELGKPIIIMPRDHALGEHRNAHQHATAQRFLDVEGVHVVADEAALADKLRRLDPLLASRNTLPTMSSTAPTSFLDALRHHLGTKFPA